MKKFIILIFFSCSVFGIPDPIPKPHCSISEALKATIENFHKSKVREDKTKNTFPREVKYIEMKLNKNAPKQWGWKILLITDFDTSQSQTYFVAKDMKITLIDITD
ncbi:MAG: hypothetical protein MK080_05255 [Opitutales bacterium]|nr:hypothetical protein [Opitutales bacterium]NRA27608.1 hypothetical protein [Opitutales bacterium]